jgi:hypothetical protein
MCLQVVVKLKSRKTITIKMTTSNGVSWETIGRNFRKFRYLRMDQATGPWGQRKLGSMATPYISTPKVNGPSKQAHCLNWRLDLEVTSGASKIMALSTRSSKVRSKRSQSTVSPRASLWVLMALSGLSAEKTFERKASISCITISSLESL